MQCNDTKLLELEIIYYFLQVDFKGAVHPKMKCKYSTHLPIQIFLLRSDKFSGFNYFFRQSSARKLTVKKHLFTNIMPQLLVKINSAQKHTF